MKKTKVTMICLISIMLCISIIFVGCNKHEVSMSSSDEADVKLTFEAYLYDNQGNNFAAFKGNSFNISPNKVKQWGYSTDGTWTSWYETSSVVTVTIDGHSLETCGSTVIFKDSRVDIEPLSFEIGTLDSSVESGYTEKIDDSVLKNYFALTNWWFDSHEKGQGGSKLILIQSQDGYNIGVIEGDDVYWEVAEKLPKTTLLTVDDKPVYIHRCNFTIIDTALFDKAIVSE